MVAYLSVQQEVRVRFPVEEKGGISSVVERWIPDPAAGGSKIAHSGDKLDRSAGRDAPRFHHECTASTFMTPTHVAFMVHMCAAATARASAKAARLYAHERATRHSLRENTLNRPAIIPAPF